MNISVTFNIYEVLQAIFVFISALWALKVIIKAFKND